MRIHPTNQRIKMCNGENYRRGSSDRKNHRPLADRDGNQHLRGSKVMFLKFEDCLDLIPAKRLHIQRCESVNGLLSAFGQLARKVGFSPYVCLILVAASV
jgi:hypothetical protein